MLITYTRFVATFSSGGRVFFYHWRACIEKAIKARHDFVRRPRDHLSRSSSREISRRPRALTLSRSINCWASNNRDRSNDRATSQWKIAWLFVKVFREKSSQLDNYVSQNFLTIYGFPTRDLLGKINNIANMIRWNRLYVIISQTNDIESLKFFWSTSNNYCTYKMDSWMN